jgi:xanthosine utilization system XapX-like protein
MTVLISMKTGILVGVVVLLDTCNKPNPAPSPGTALLVISLFLKSLRIYQITLFALYWLFIA